MRNIINLDNLTPADLPRLQDAVKRLKAEQARANRRQSIERAREAQAALRAELAKQGKKLPRRQTLSKGELEQIARKAAETLRKKRSLPTTCEVCGGAALAKGLCMRHHKAWKRSGVPRERFVEWYDGRELSRRVAAAEST